MSQRQGRTKAKAGNGIETIRQLLNTNNIAQAEQQLPTVINPDEDRYSYYYGLAEIAYRKGDYSKACEITKRHGDQKDPEILILQGNCLKQQRQYEPAIGCYNQAIQLVDEKKSEQRHSLAFAYLMRAEVYRDLGTQEDALNDAQQAVTYNPSLSCAWELLAQLQRTRGTLMEALKSFLKAYQLTPQSSLAAQIREVDQQFVDQRSDDNTSLHQFVVRESDVTVVQSLLATGIDCTRVNIFGQTALHSAAMSGHLEMMTLLLAQIGEGALAEQDNKGRTAFDLALHYGHVALLHHLITQYAVINTGSMDIIYQYACRAIELKQLNSLIYFVQQYPKVIHHQDAGEQTLLHKAALANHFDTIDWLCEKTSIDFKHCDHAGKQAEDLTTDGNVFYRLQHARLKHERKHRRKENIALTVAQTVIIELIGNGDLFNQQQIFKWTETIKNCLLASTYFGSHWAGSDEVIDTDELATTIITALNTILERQSAPKINSKIIEKQVKSILEQRHAQASEAQQITMSSQQPVINLINADDDTLAQHVAIRRFCLQFELQFDVTFGQLRALAIGNVRKPKDGAHQLADLGSVAAASSQQEGGVATSIATILLFRLGLKTRDLVSQYNAKRVWRFFDGVSPYARTCFVRKFAFYLAKKYRLQLSYLMTGNSIEQLAEYAVERIIEYILKREKHSLSSYPSHFKRVTRRINSYVRGREIPTESKQLKPLWDVFFDGFHSINHSSSNSGHTYLPTIGGSDIRWLAKSVFENTGIITPDGKRYASDGCELEIFGYCFGSAEEAELRGLKIFKSTHTRWPEGKQWPEHSLEVTYTTEQECKQELLPEPTETQMVITQDDDVAIKTIRHLLSQGQRSQAEDHIRHLVANSPANLAYRYWHAKIVYQRDDYQETLNLLEQADKNDPEVFILRGCCQYALIEYLSAIADYGRAIALAQNEEGAELSLAFAYLKRAEAYSVFQDYVQAFKDAQQAALYNPELSKAWVLMAQKFMMESNYLEAARCYLTAYNVFSSHSILSQLTSLDKKFIESNEDNNSLLHHLILAGDEALIQSFVQTRISLNHDNLNQQTPLSLAVDLGDLSKVKVLIEAGAQLKNGRELLTSAIVKGHLQIVHYLIEEVAIVNVDAKVLYQLVCQAIVNNQGSVLRWLIDAYPIVMHYRNEREHTVLHRAISYNHVEAAHYLFSKMSAMGNDILDDFMPQPSTKSEKDSLIKQLQDSHQRKQNRQNSHIHDICEKVHAQLVEKGWSLSETKVKKLNRLIEKCLLTQLKIRIHLREEVNADTFDLASAIVNSLLRHSPDPKVPLKTSSPDLKAAIQRVLRLWQPDKMYNTPADAPSAPPEQTTADEVKALEPIGNPLKRFCQRFETQFDLAFCELRALAQGSVRKKADDVDDARDLTLISTSTTPNIFSGVIVATLMDLALNFRERYRQEKACYMLKVFESKSPLERTSFIRDIAFNLAEKYKEQLEFLDPATSSMEHFADCAVARVVEYITISEKNILDSAPTLFERVLGSMTNRMTGRNIPQEAKRQKDLYQIFLEGIIRVKSSSAQHGEQTALRTQGDVDWTAKELFENTGIVTPDGTRYAHEKCLRCGYCLGTSSEARKRGLTERQSSGTPWPEIDLQVGHPQNRPKLSFPSHVDVRRLTLWEQDEKDASQHRSLEEQNVAQSKPSV